MGFWCSQLFAGLVDAVRRQRLFVLATCSSLLSLAPLLLYKLLLFYVPCTLLRAHAAQSVSPFSLSTSLTLHSSFSTSSTALSSDEFLPIPLKSLSNSCILHLQLPPLFSVVNPPGPYFLSDLHTTSRRSSFPSPTSLQFLSGLTPTPYPTPPFNSSTKILAALYGNRINSSKPHFHSYSASAA